MRLVATFWYLLLPLHFHITYIHSLNGTHIIFEISWLAIVFLSPAANHGW
jgi:hypothetical protein